MGLNDDQIFDLSLELSDALGKAFTNEESLGLMVARSLRTPLNRIKQNAQSYEATVDKVVEHAISVGKVLNLVIGASQRNPKNPQLRKFSQDKLRELFLVGKSNLLNDDLNDDLLALLIQALKPISGNEEFKKTVLPACTQTFPDIDTSAPDLREQLCNDALSDATKWLILLDLFLNNWGHNSDEQLYIVLFVQNLKFLTKGSVQTALTQWLNDLPKSIRPASQVLEQKIYPERPSDEALKKIQAYFLLTVEPVETSDSDKYRINGYVITRLGNEDRYTKIENILLHVPVTQEANESLKMEPYYTIEQVNHNLPDWLLKANELIENQSIEIQKSYNLELPPVADLTIEFWLPFEHLITATETWSIYGEPIRLKQLTSILGQEYRVLVRSYDRFSEPRSLNELIRTWRELGSPSQKPVNTDITLTSTPHLECWNDWKSLQEELKQIYLSLSLTCSLCTQDSKKQREALFSWVLKKGIPLVLWSRSVDLTDEQKAALKQKMQGMLTADTFNQLEHLFETIRLSRTVDTEEQLALWCDEPKRLIELKNFREKGRLRA